MRKPKISAIHLVLLTIALGTSIDAFAVGISFALLDVKIWEGRIAYRRSYVPCFNDCNTDRKISRGKTREQSRDYRRSAPDCNRIKDLSGTYAGNLKLILMP